MHAHDADAVSTNVAPGRRLSTHRWWLVPLLLVVTACSMPLAADDPTVTAPTVAATGVTPTGQEAASTAQPSAIPVPSAPTPPTTSATPTELLTPTVAPTPTTPPLPPGVSRPPWLGTVPLEVGPDGNALPAPTPEELVVRRIPTIDILPPPTDGQYHATISEMTPDIIARSTWSEQCPVGVDELRYLTMTFWGFDERPHTGEMIVNAQWAEEVTEIFRGLYEARFPIEEMRVVSSEELDGIPTGDTNDTTSFVCRPTRGSSSWSQHAYGLAVDINPFINPYQRGERILPELAGAYLDRSHVRPGMIFEGDHVVQSFDALGWGWGGRWNSLVDYMHFSANGR